MRKGWGTGSAWSWGGERVYHCCWQSLESGHLERPVFTATLHFTSQHTDKTADFPLRKTARDLEKMPHSKMFKEGAGAIEQQQGI